MSTTTKTAHRSFASLKLPNKVPALITYAQGIVKAMTGNPAFPSPTPTLSAVTDAINELQTAETAALARTKGAVATRNEKRAALATLLQQLRGHIQATADASPENAASVIQSARVALRKTPVLLTASTRRRRRHPTRTRGAAISAAWRPRARAAVTRTSVARFIDARLDLW